MIGKPLAHYEITALLGEGGMGKVYQATDTKLGREVALKVLPESFTRDPQRLARFKREAQVLASLNHPNIGAIYGLAEGGAVQALVLELISGETLAERIAQGPVPVEEALPIAVQIAEALEAAHEKGIIHRDLKPANIKVTDEGKVKVLDFGLAKGFEAEGTTSPELSHSPTRVEGTAIGVILGTASYMSPEQARGKTVDKRTDIWAFGCCLFEILTGKKPFAGETLSDTISLILQSTPQWSLLPSQVPAPVRRVLQRCLRKKWEERLRDIGDAGLELREAEDVTTPVVQERLASGGWIWLLLVALASAALVGLLLWPTSPPPLEPTYLSVQLPGNLRLTGLPQTFAPPIAISPDGRTLAITAHDGGGRSQLFIRELQGFEIGALAGTDGATSPFFSPDGEWIGFHASGKLKKIPKSGGTIVTICDAPLFSGLGIDWGSDGMIVFNRATFSGLFQVSESGGLPEPLTTVEPQNGERGHAHPQILGDGGDFLFSTWGESNAATFFDSETGKSQRIHNDWSSRPDWNGLAAANLLPTGHIAFLEDPGFTSEAQLQIAPFDVNSLEVTGPPVPMLGGIDHLPRSGRASFVISAAGHLAYVPSRPLKRRLTWVDRQGNKERLTEADANYQFPQISADGRRVVFQLDDVWILDLERGTRSRETTEGFVNFPVWNPPGTHIVYSWSQRGPWNMFLKPAGESGAGELLLESPQSQFPVSWSPEGLLAFEERHPETGYDIWLWAPDSESEAFLTSGFNEQMPMFSPDGRFIAYVSNESGRDEVYVQPHPRTGQKWTISTEGGTEPLWAPNGEELFYRYGTGVWAVEIETGGEFQPGAPWRLFEGEFVSDIFPNYDIAPDGQRFLMVENETPPAGEIRIILNWFEELKGFEDN